MYDFSGIIYIVWGVCGIIFLLGLICILLTSLGDRVLK